MNKRLADVLTVALQTVMLFSCDGGCKEDPYEKWEATSYSLSIKFENAEGKSLMDSIPTSNGDVLVAPIEGIYREIFVANPTKKFELKSGRCNGNPQPKLDVIRSYLDSSIGGEWRLYYNDMMTTGKYSRDTLFYELKFPALFRDNDVHRMVAYWTTPSKTLDNKHYAFCNYIELDGQELQVVTKAHLYGIKSALAITNQITIRAKQ